MEIARRDKASSTTGGLLKSRAHAAIVFEPLSGLIHPWQGERCGAGQGDSLESGTGIEGTRLLSMATIRLTSIQPSQSLEAHYKQLPSDVKMTALSYA
jgi:hypothetical protein